MFFCRQKVEKNTSKSCILKAVGRFFFSADLTAQNSLELHFRFINSFIQSSLLRSLYHTHIFCQNSLVHTGKSHTCKFHGKNIAQHSQYSPEIGRTENPLISHCLLLSHFQPRSLYKCQGQISTTVFPHIVAARI